MVEPIVCTVNAVEKLISQLCKGIKYQLPTYPGDFQTNFSTGDNFKACPVKANIKPTSARK